MYVRTPIRTGMFRLTLRLDGKQMIFLIFETGPARSRVDIYLFFPYSNIVHYCPASHNYFLQLLKKILSFSQTLVVTLVFRLPSERHLCPPRYLRLDGNRTEPARSRVDSFVQ